MKRDTLYPTWTWLTWTLVIPLAVLGGGIGLAAMTDVGDLPFDNAGLWWLGGVVPVAGLLLLYGWFRRRQAVARFASEELAVLLAARHSPGRQALRAGLVVLALLLIVAAILGPRWGIYMEKQKVRGIDVVVALDVSRSMLAEDVSPNRLERAKTEIRQQLVERAVFRQANRLGLLVFAGSTSLRVPLTTDHLAFRGKLEGIDMGSAPRGGTAVGEAIRAATELFAKSPQHATKIILLLTDGEDHEGGPVDAAAAAYKEHGIRVFTVAVGDTSRTAGAQVPSSGGEHKPLLHDGQIVFSRVDEAGLRRIAEAGGGQYATIKELYALVQTMGGMWKAELTTEERQRHKPRYQWFLAAALVLLAMETMIADHRKGEPRPRRRVWTEEASR